MFVTAMEPAFIVPEVMLFALMFITAIDPELIVPEVMLLALIFVTFISVESIVPAVILLAERVPILASVTEPSFKKAVDINEFS